MRRYLTAVLAAFVFTALLGCRPAPTTTKADLNNPPPKPKVGGGGGAPPPPPPPRR